MLAGRRRRRNGPCTRPAGAGGKPLRKIHTAATVLEAAHLRNLLESAGIRCFVRNEGLAGAVGELPFVECWPEVWVVHNGDALRARGLIDAAREAEPPRGPDWRCERCGELVEGQFEECWRCAPALQET